MLRIAKKVIHLAILIVLVVLLFLFIVRGYVVATTTDCEQDTESLVAACHMGGEAKQFDAIIVLGASVKRDLTPSQILKNRLDKAVELWNAGVAKQILVSGDHREGDYDEVDAMWDYLMRAGVPNEAIKKDYNGFSTYESMYNVAQEHLVNNIIVVTQQYHLYRAAYIGRSYNLNVVGVAAENAGSFFERLYRTLRETPACLKDINYCYQQKEF